MCKRKEHTEHTELISKKQYRPFSSFTSMYRHLKEKIGFNKDVEIAFNLCFILLKPIKFLSLRLQNDN